MNLSYDINKCCSYRVLGAENGKLIVVDTTDKGEVLKGDSFILSETDLLKRKLMACDDFLNCVKDDNNYIPINEFKFIKDSYGKLVKLVIRYKNSYVVFEIKNNGWQDYITMKNVINDEEELILVKAIGEVEDYAYGFSFEGLDGLKFDTISFNISKGILKSFETDDNVYFYPEIEQKRDYMNLNIESIFTIRFNLLNKLVKKSLFKRFTESTKYYWEFKLHYDVELEKFTKVVFESKPKKEAIEVV